MKFLQLERLQMFKSLSRHRMEGTPSISKTFLKPRFWSNDKHYAQTGSKQLPSYPEDGQMDNSMGNSCTILGSGMRKLVLFPVCSNQIGAGQWCSYCCLKSKIGALFFMFSGWFMPSSSSSPGSSF